MKRRTRLGLLTAVALALVGLAPSRAGAVQAPPGPGNGLTVTPVSSGGLVSAPGVGAVRHEIDASYGAPPASRQGAWERFLKASGSARWQALWDRDTGAPVRVFGAGLPAPGTIDDAAVAESIARAFLREQADLLAPGLDPAWFELAANDRDGGLRTVAFTQRAPLADGSLVPVIGGRASLRFKHDRLFVFGSEAIAAPSVLPLPQIEGPVAEAAALAWIGEAHGDVAILSGARLVALPLVGGGRAALRVVYEVVIDALAPRARYAVYLDARSGAPVAREQLLRFAGTQVLFDAPVRAPQYGRMLYPAPFLAVAVDGQGAQTNASGMLSWDSSPGAVDLAPHGGSVYVFSKHGADATAQLSAADGVPLSWSLAGDEHGDAQLSGFVHAGLVKVHGQGIAPAMPFTKSQLAVRVNIQDAQGCNAFWDGAAVNFFEQNASCSNSARIADVVYHEFGHGFHQHAIIAGAGAFDPSLGEGTGDIMAASMTHDPQLGPGFFLGSDAPLRDMSTGRRWPDDISWDPHETGLIWAGAMWDLRVYLTAELGDTAGNSLTDQLYFQAIRRSSSIPTTYVEVLAADDDDGDLANGTPHICAINRAFVPHGLAPVLDEAGLVVHHEALAIVPADGLAHPITVTAERLYPQCAPSPIEHVDLRYRVAGLTKQVELVAEGDAYQGLLPSQPAGTHLQYAILTSVNGFTRSLPDNLADDAYSVFVGTPVPLYCNDFEAQVDGWTFGGPKGSPGDFQWGEPAGKAGDPTNAFSGAKVLGDRLSGDGTYKRNQTVFAESPILDRAGKTHLRLQFRRWLAVQDGALDQASILVNGSQVWQNVGTAPEDGSMSHEDREWRFVDLDLDGVVGSAPTIQVRFELTSDNAVQLGGWTIDDFCVVSWEPPPVVPDFGPLRPLPGRAAAMDDLVARGACDCTAGGVPTEGGAALAGLVIAAALGRRRGAIRSRRCRRG